jgi:predicted small secreted protein
MKSILFGRCVATLLLVGTLLSLTGCNTVAGFGQDIQDSARTVQRAL